MAQAAFNQLLTFKLLKNQGSERLLIWPEIFTVLLGISYGLGNLIVMREQLPELQSIWMHYVIAPGLFLIGGIFMAYLSRIGITLVCWAMVKMLGGPGNMKGLSKIVGFSYVFFLPAVFFLLTATGVSQAIMLSIGSIASVGILMGLIFLSTNITHLQKISIVRSALSIFLTVVFIGSVYYLMLPQ